MKKQVKRPASVDLYNTSYDNFAAHVLGEVHAQTYGGDLGQSSWMTADELRYAFSVRSAAVLGSSNDSAP